MQSETRRQALVLFLLSVFLLLPALGARDLWAPDEPRYAEVVREMLLEDEWIVLRDNGKVYPDKPPLYFWLAAGVSRFSGGVSEAAARLPSALAGIAGLFVTFLLGKELFSTRAGFLAASILATTYGYFSQSIWVHLDSTLTLFMTLSLFCLLKARRNPRPGFGWRAGFYCFLGLAMLTKGPVGFILPLAVGVVYFWMQGESRNWLRWGLWWGLPLACGMILIWAWAAGVRSGGEYSLAQVLSTHVLGRVSRGLHHLRGPGYFFVHLPLEFLPWSLFLPTVLFTGIREAVRARHPGVRFCLSWAGVMFLIFTLSAEKRALYMLPLFPALAALTGWYWDRRLASPEPGRLSGGIRIPLGAWGTVLCAAAWLPAWIGSDYPDLFRVSIGLSALLFTVGLVQWWVVLRGGMREVHGTLVAGTACLLLFVGTAIAPAMNPYKSARPLCERVRARAEGYRLGLYGDYRSTYVYYTGRFVEEIRTPEELNAFLDPPGGAFFLIQEKDYQNLPLPLRRDLHLLERQGVGHRTMLLVSNRLDPPEGT